jgi:hypothetical protein
MTEMSMQMRLMLQLTLQMCLQLLPNQGLRQRNSSVLQMMLTFQR